MSLLARARPAKYPKGFVRDLEVSWGSVSELSVVAGSCRDSTNLYDMENPSSKSIDISLSGVGGLDTGSEAANTWYAVYLIGDSSEVNPVAGMLSLSDSSPTLPLGYDIFRRLGWVRNNNSSDFFKFKQLGNTNLKKVFYDEEQSALEILVNGAATTWTTINAGILVPNTSRLFIAHISMSMANWTEYAHFRETGSTINDSPFKGVGLANNNLRFGADSIELLVNGLQQLDYRVDDVNDFLTIAVQGFYDDL